MTHATLHPNAGADELRSITHRCKGLHAVKLQQLHPEAAAATLEALAAMQHLRSLDMPMFDGMQLDDWAQLSGLTQLTLRHVKMSHHGTLAAVLPRLTSLRSLVLAEHLQWQYLPRGLQSADVQRFASLSRLTHLDLGRANGIAALAPQLPDLQSLALALRSKDAWTTLQQELSALARLPRLRRLHLAADIRDARLRWIRLGPNVTVSYQHLYTPDNVGAQLQNEAVPLQGIPHLVAVDLGCWLPPMPYRCRQGTLEPDTPFDTLRELRLYGCNVTSDMKYGLMAVARRLRVLQLRACEGALAQVLEAAAVVEEVSLQGVKGCGDRLLEALKCAAGTLRGLDLNSQWIELWSSSFEHLEALTGLTRLAYGAKAEGCDALGTIAQLTRLQELRLCCPSGFDDAQLAQLSTLSRLATLELSGWGGGSGQQHATGSWLAALASAQVPLRQLRLFQGDMLPGCGAEAAIGRLTRLTSLHLVIDRARDRYCASQLPPSPTCQLPCGAAPAPLQLHQLGCSAEEARACVCSGFQPSRHGNAGGGSLAGRNTSLQDLVLVCVGPLSDGELAAAAAALPDLRRLELRASEQHLDPLHGLRGVGLAAFDTCRRLRHISLRGCRDLEGQQLVAQLPHMRALSSLTVVGSPRVDSESMKQLHAAFRAKQLRGLLVVHYERGR